MKDIFDAKILCEQCDVPMKQTEVFRSGFRLRAVGCPKCGEKIVHPVDLEVLNQYKDLKRKTFDVKLRVVGNSHAISIPKEIVDFISESREMMQKEMNDMVRLCFEDFGKLRVDFFGDAVIAKSVKNKKLGDEI